MWITFMILGRFYKWLLFTFNICCVCAGLSILPQVQSQDRVQEVMWKASQTFGGYRQVACASGECQSR